MCQCVLSKSSTGFIPLTWSHLPLSNNACTVLQIESYFILWYLYIKVYTMYFVDFHKITFLSLYNECIWHTIK